MGTGEYVPVYVGRRGGDARQVSGGHAGIFISLTIVLVIFSVSDHFFPYCWSPPSTAATTEATDSINRHHLGDWVVRKVRGERGTRVWYLQVNHLEYRYRGRLVIGSQGERRCWQAGLARLHASHPILVLGGASHVKCIYWFIFPNYSLSWPQIIGVCVRVCVPSVAHSI